MDVKFDVILQQVREADGESGLEPTVNRHTAQIAQNTAAITDHESRIGELEHSVPEGIWSFGAYGGTGLILRCGNWA